MTQAGQAPPVWRTVPLFTSPAQGSNDCRTTAHCAWGW
jgi:hypothetical protein